MYVYMYKYKFTLINTFGAALLFRTLVFPQHFHLLQNITEEGSIVAIGVCDSEKPVALVLAEIWPHINFARIHSIFVLPTYRCHGIGTVLLARLEKELLSRGCNKIKIRCKTGKPITIALERLLQKCNWSLPKPIRIVCKSDWDTIANAPWLYIKYRIPRDMVIFPWAEITTQERALLQQTQKAKPWIEEGLNPFQHEENFEPLNSLGLRYQGQVVGWLLTERIAPDTISYDCMYVQEDFQRMGRGIALVVHAIQLQAQAQISRGIWYVDVENVPMICFVKKRMASYLTSIEEVCESFKLLN